MMLQDKYFVLLPYQLAIMYSAFDAAWPECAPDYEGSPTSVEVGRLRLANAVLAAYQSGVRETGMMKAAALRRMAMRRHGSHVALGGRNLRRSRNVDADK
jgi:hypothetical protein